MTPLQQAARRLIREHGGVRKAATAVGIDYSYLSRLASGDRREASDAVLQALGLRRVVRYEPI